MSSSQKRRKPKPSRGFVSLGMTVIDEIHLASGEVLSDVPGGPGLYATVGAKIAESLAPNHPIGYLLIAGNDFPQTVRDLFKKLWKVNLWTLDVEQPSTRGVWHYHGDSFDDNKTYRSLTTPLKPNAAEMDHTYMLGSRAFHIFGSPSELREHIDSLHSLRAAKYGDDYERPLILWEPCPLSCSFENLEELLSICKDVDVFSPNHVELLALVKGGQNPRLPFSRSVIEEWAGQFLEAMTDPLTRGIVVIRCGEHGCCVLSREMEAEWLDPFYPSIYAGSFPVDGALIGEPEYRPPITVADGFKRIVDPTGAGSAFLGGFAMAVFQYDNPYNAALNASAVASFMVEQVGPPQKTKGKGRLKVFWPGGDFAHRASYIRPDDL